MLRELSLCGILIRDETLFVNAICRLKMLRQVRFCGVPALNDSTMEKVNIYCCSYFYLTLFTWPKWQLFNVAGYLIRGEAQMAYN